MRRLAIQFAFGFGALFMGALTFAAVAGFFTFTGDPLKKLGLIIRIPLLVAATVALARQALKVPKTPEPFFTSVKDQLEGLPELRDIYLARHLASSARGDFTSYSSVSSSSLFETLE